MGALLDAFYGDAWVVELRVFGVGWNEVLWALHEHVDVGLGVTQEG